MDAGVVDDSGRTSFAPVKREPIRFEPLLSPHQHFLHRCPHDIHWISPHSNTTRRFALENCLGYVSRFIVRCCEVRLTLILQLRSALNCSGNRCIWSCSSYYPRRRCAANSTIDSAGTILGDDVLVAESYRNPCVLCAGPHDCQSIPFDLFSTILDVSHSQFSTTTSDFRRWIVGVFYQPPTVNRVDQMLAESWVRLVEAVGESGKDLQLSRRHDNFSSDRWDLLIHRSR